MKKSILAILIAATIVSCSKEAVLPSQTAASASTTDNASIQPVVNFNISTPHIIYLTQGLNTLQSDSFSVLGATCYATKFTFAVTGTPNLSGFKFYINGGQVRATVTYANNEITVAMRTAVTLVPGNFNYILQARTAGVSGSTFTMMLSGVSIVDNKRFQVSVNNLPLEGNTLIMR